MELNPEIYIPIVEIYTTVEWDHETDQHVWLDQEAMLIPGEVAKLSRLHSKYGPLWVLELLIPLDFN